MEKRKNFPKADIKKKNDRTNTENKNINSSVAKEPLFTKKKIVQRLFCALVLLAGVYWTSWRENEVSVKATDNYQRYTKQVDCSTNYDKEKSSFPACFPKRCGRVITDGLVTIDDATKLLGIAKKGLALGGSSGGASILDLHSGALSKGDAFVNIYKHPSGENIFSEDDFLTYRTVKNKIHRMISSEFGVVPTHLYLTHPTFFSKITPKPARTLHDEYWHPHVDKETYPSFHYTSLLYLTSFAKDFNGGRFFFVDEKRNMSVEPRIGRVSMFTSGPENLHYVEKVSSGERYALTVSFTCDTKFAIQDPG